MQLFFLLTLTYFALTSAFLSSNIRRNENNGVHASMSASEKKNYSFLEILSGKSLVENEKRSNPMMFETGKSQNKNKELAKKANVKITGTATEAIELFRKQYKTPLPGGSYDVEDKELAFSFNNLVAAVKDESIALEMVKVAPALLVTSVSRVKDNLAIYSEKWGAEKALGVVRRNPNLLSVPSTGYGSAETAADETIYVSYVIAATRPIGKPLLAVLFLALLKPFAVQVIEGTF